MAAPLAVRLYKTRFWHRCFTYAIHRSSLNWASIVAAVADLLSLARQNQQAGNLPQLYRQILEADPNHTGALDLLAMLFAQKGKLDDAVQCFQHALRLQPDNAERQNNLAIVLGQQGNASLAIHHFQRALELKPDLVAAHYNLANAYQKQGGWEAAAAGFLQALRLQPNHAYAHNNLGLVLMTQGRLAEAAACFHLALRFLPEFAEAHHNLGCVLARQFNYDEAIGSAREAIRLKPDYAAAYANLGDVHKDLCQFDEALACYREALRLDPHLTAVHSNLLFCLNYHPLADPDAVFAEHCRWGRQQLSVSSCQLSVKTAQTGMSVPPLTTDNWQLITDNYADSERRLRIGYVSPDFRYHALVRYFEPVLANHDPRQVEVFCYAEVPFLDAVTCRLQGLAKHWRWINGQPDEKVADSIRSDSIDILLDLAGHTAGSRLTVFAHKPAPVQATWLGYLNTTGLIAIDYRLTDEVLDPPGQPVRDTEELVRLPGGMCCFAPNADTPEIVPLPALQRGYLTFGSPHTLFKLNSSVFDLWREVLTALPTAHLLLFRDSLNARAQDRIRHEFAGRGISRDRLDLLQIPTTPNYLEVYRQIDVTLDAFPCTGGVTTCESMWMGVPVLSLRGFRPPGRQSASLLSRAGMSEWAVEDRKQFVAMAVAAANDLNGLARLRASMRQRMAPLCDAKRFTAELEDAYRTMWRRWLSGRQ
jgi:protein O-GlcNAc transferase